MPNSNEVEILLVENNARDAELTIRALKKHHLAGNLVHVKDGAEALDFIFAKGKYSERTIQNGPKVVLLDLKLPKVDGLEVLHQIKSDERTKIIPVVVLTSSKAEQDLVRSHQLGVNSYILKSVDFDKLLNEELEERGKQRTAQLEAANKELEAFSYSVSHDLQGPVRAIDSFSKILIEEQAQQLDQEGLRMLNIVRDKTGRMRQPFDDLLAFARISRQDMIKSPIDVTKMVNSIIKELQSAEPTRTVNVTLHSLPKVHGDISMIRQMFVNLLSNAFKFTRHQPNPIIVIGCTAEGNETVCYVKDNGAGFDMHYKDKLFGVFQRLHTTDEFEGTGVGLAIVRRVIHRHGGRVWAEAEVGKGATFYLTLPKTE